ncbi:MAG: hypothetical protein HC888_03705 [Candidatus Competibacteraceae bacterium]|nr:hypothetical protein [Candidatus Competibacteraceae bacterium]
MANLDRPNGFRAVANLGGGAIPMFEGMAASNVSLAPGDAIIQRQMER